MAKKSNFLRPMKKQAGRNVGVGLGGTTLRYGTLFGANFGLRKLEEKGKPTARKISAAGGILLDMAAQVFVDPSTPGGEVARAAAAGIGDASAIHGAELVLPEDVQQKIGIAGLGATVIDSTPDWSQLADQAAKAAGESAAADEEPEVPLSDYENLSGTGKDNEDDPDEYEPDEDEDDDELIAMAEDILS